MEIPDEVDEVSAAVYDPDGNTVKSTFQKEPDGLYHLRFIPTKIGQYNVSRVRSRLISSHRINLFSRSR